MLPTVALPPVVFSLTKDEFVRYLAPTFVSAPAIQLVFSFFFGWRVYMPFLYILSLWELVGG